MGTSLNDLGAYGIIRVSGSSLFSLWTLCLILPKYALHIALRLSCSVGVFTICSISSYVKPRNILLRHRFGIISTLSDKYFKFLCHAGQVHVPYRTCSCAMPDKFMCHTGQVRVPCRTSSYAMLDKFMCHTGQVHVPCRTSSCAMPDKFMCHAGQANLTTGLITDT